MRLSEGMIKKLKLALYQSFGHVPVYLFGSRTSDQKRGGDIDLAIDVQLPSADFTQKKIKFKTILAYMGFDEVKVDIVPYHPHNTLLAKEISATAIPLI